MNRRYLAIDLGAESGRVMLGTLADGRIELDEMHRFSNPPLRVEGSLCWNTNLLFAGILEGLRRAAIFGREIRGVSCDSWGLDYFLFDGEGSVVEPTFQYRDARNERGMKTAFEKIPWEQVFEETGIQRIRINTLFQLAAESPERFAKARVLLPIADGFNRMLCGVAKSEVSLASTTQLYNPRKKTWSISLLKAIGVPLRIFPELIPAGTILGPLTEQVARETGLPRIDVIASCSHDTGAAVAAVPAEGDDWAYISSGTWSLMGIELAEPVINEVSRQLNFTNEIGYGNTVRLLKNIVGLWLLQECKHTWEKQGLNLDYAEITRRAAEAEPFRAFIDVADPRFLEPGDMPGRIANYCRETGQPAPNDEAQTARLVFESLALQYQKTRIELETLLGKPLRKIHLVGGGSKNDLLSQLTANATGLPVIAGPAEATAAGNVLVQAITTGDIADLPTARAIMARSTTPKTFQPADGAAWQTAWRRFQKLTSSHVYA
jgi:rhamnulokinase